MDVATALTAAGCAAESSLALPVERVQAAATPYSGTRLPISIGRFDNRSNFMRGVFSDGVDRLGSQAKTTLTADLQDSQRLNVLNRDNMGEARRGAQLQGQAQSLKGAAFLVTGDITEFGRKEVGDHHLFGLLGRGKTQVAYTKIMLNIVNTLTTEAV